MANVLGFNTESTNEKARTAKHTAQIGQLQKKLDDLLKTQKEQVASKFLSDTIEFPAQSKMSKHQRPRSGVPTTIDSENHTGTIKRHASNYMVYNSSLMKEKQRPGSNISIRPKSHLMQRNRRNQSLLIRKSIDTQKEKNHNPVLRLQVNATSLQHHIKKGLTSEEGF